MDIKEARKIFQEHFFGRDEVELVYGEVFYFDETLYTTIGLTEEEALFYQQKGYALVFVPENQKKADLSLHDLSGAFLAKNHKPLLFDLDDEYKWYNKDANSFIFNERLSSGWFLYTVSILEGSDFSLYSKQEEIIKNEVASLVISFGDDEKKETTVSHSRPRVIDEVFYQGMASVLCKDFDRDRYIWTRTQLGNEYVRVGRYSEGGMEMTKRDIFDGNSMTGASLLVRI